MESEKKIINTHIRAIVRECSIIIGGRNKKLKDQKCMDQKKFIHISKQEKLKKSIKNFESD